MLKKLLYPLLVAVPVTAIAFFFPWRVKFLEDPVRLALENLSGKHVTLSKVIFRPYNRLTIENLNIEGTFKAPVVTVYFDPLKLARSRSIPYSIRKIISYGPEISIPGDTGGMLGPPGNNGAPAAKYGKPGDVILIWNNGRLFYKGQTLSSFSGQARLNESINAKINAKYLGGLLSCDIVAAKPGGRNEVNVAADYKGLNSQVDLKIFFKETEGGSTEVHYEIPLIKFGDYSLSGSSGSIRYGGGAVSGLLSTRAGNYTLEGGSFDSYTSSGSFRLSNIQGVRSGKIDVSARRNEAGFNLAVNVSSLSANGLIISKAAIHAEEGPDGRWNFGGAIEPARYSFQGVINADQKFDLSLRSQGGGSGSVTGALSPLSLSVSIKDWNLAKTPLLESVYPGMTGNLSLEGEISSRQQKYRLDLADCRYLNSLKDSLSASIIDKNDIWFIRARSAAQGWILRTKYASPRDWNTDIAFDRTECGNFCAWLKSDHKFGGLLTGNLSFSSKYEGSAKLTAENLSFDDQPIGNARVNVDLNGDRAKIEGITVYAQNGKINLWGQVGLSQENSLTALNVNIHQLTFQNKLVDGRLLLTGRMIKDRGWQFAGLLKSGKFTINKWTTKDLSASIRLSDKTLLISEFNWTPYVKGYVNFNLPYKTVDGTFIVEYIPLEFIEPVLQGTAKGVLKLSGNFKNPEAELKYTAPGSVYNGLKFGQEGSIHYFNGTLRTKNIRLTCANGFADIKGTFLPRLELIIPFSDIPGSAIAQAAGIKDELGGLFSGELKLRPGTASKPEIYIGAAGKNVSYGGISLNDLKFNALYKNGRLNVNSAMARYSDSEFKILQGSYLDLESSRFEFKSDCRNIHAGPCDIFGKISASGNFSKDAGGKLDVNGEISADNIWINQYNLSNFKTAVRFKNGALAFEPREKSELKLSGLVDLNHLPVIQFNHLKLGRDRKRELVLDGGLGKNNWDFTVAGKNLDVSAVGDLAGLTFPCEGRMDLNITAKGNVEHPRLEASIDLYDGKISEIPYDSINFQLSSHQDVITIVKSRLVKKKQFSIVASGYCPFFLTSAGAKRTRNNALDINVTFEEGSLLMLRALTSDIEDAKGSFQAQAHVTGTLAKPIANGYFKTTGGVVWSKRYFRKMYDINIDLLWRNNLLSVKSFSSRIGEGLMKIKGKIIFVGFVPKLYDLTWFTEGSRGVPITVPELPIPSPLFKSENWQLLSNLTQGEPRFSLGFSGPSDNPLLSGWVDLENTHFTFPSLAKSSGNESILDDLWPKLNWNLELRAAKNTWYDNDLVSANITGGIRLTGRGAQPDASGHIECIKGSAVYFGTEFVIKSAAVDIVKDNVVLQAQAESEVYSTTPGEDDTIQLFIDKAEIGKIQPRFVSKNDPTMTPEKAMAKATGINPDTTSSSDMSFLLRKSVVRFVDSTLTTPLAKNLLKRSGIVDTFRIQYVAQDAVTPVNPASPTIPELLSGTKYSLQKFITDRMLLGYSMTLDELENKLSPRHQLEVSYNLLKNLSIKGSYDLESNNPLHQDDRRITLEQQWRFGSVKKKAIPRKDKSNQPPSENLLNLPQK